jgi:hypothetical protein
MKTTIAIAAVLALSGAALAGGTAQLSTRGTLPIAPPVADRAGIQVDVTLVGSINSFDAFGDADNIISSFDIPVVLGPGETIVITGIGWDVSLTAIDPSLLEELVVDIRDASATSGISLTPGFGADIAGTQTFDSEVVKLADAGLTNLPLTGTTVTLEFFENFDDFAGEADGSWNQGSIITIQYVVVPTPGSAALIGLAGLVGLRRRR